GALAGDYLLTDVSPTRLVWVTGQTQPHEVARLHLVVLVVGWAAVVALARVRFGHRTARTLSVLLAASPLVTVSMQWLGQPDPLTGLCGVAMVLVRRRWAVLALGVLAGITHPEQALFMAGVAGTVRCLLPPGRPATGDSESAPNSPAPTPAGVLASTALAVGGVVVGWAAVQLWFRVSDITLSTPRSDYLSYGLGTFWDHHLTQPVGLLWTLWGPLWLVIAAVAFAGIRRWLAGTPAWWVMAALAVLALAPTLVTLDETRVYAVITAPLLAAAATWLVRSFDTTALHNSTTQSHPRALRNASIALLVVTAILPGGFATGTTSWRSQLDAAAMVTFLLDGSIDGENAQESQVTPFLLEPFDFVIPDPPQ
ncbi:MAG: hypothetical protein ACR2OH_13485, partial [Microthrixaceae bacterium]